MAEPYLLLVEPDEGRRRAIEAFASARRWETVTSATALRSDPPLLVVISAFGDAPTALSLLRSLRAEPRLSGVPVLAVTPAPDPTSADAFLAAGADDVLPWPATEAQMKARLSSLAAAAPLRAEIAAFSRILNSFARALEARVPYTAGHSQRVAEIAAAVARALGFSSADVETIRRGSWIHGIGEVTVPEHDLTSATRLTEEEEERIRAHPVAGYQMLQGAASLAPLLPFVRMHHERIDGSGYPDGLVGDEIPRGVQIMSLADAYVALASPRAFRPARSHEAAIRILEKEAQKGIWDGELVKALDAAVRRITPADVAETSEGG